MREKRKKEKNYFNCVCGFFFYLFVLLCLLVYLCDDIHKQRNKKKIYGIKKNHSISSFSIIKFNLFFKQGRVGEE